MATKIALNGFGRIGRYLVRLMADTPELEVVAINARSDNASLAHLFKYDSVHGKFQGEVGHNDEGIVVNGKTIRITRDNLGEYSWGDLDVDIAVETTGTAKDRSGAQAHIDCGAKKCIVSAPCKGADLTVVMGVNDDLYDPAEHLCLSNASCTTNCLAPVVKVLHENFGIKHGLMTTVHAYTMSQRILDGSHKDLRRARSAAMSLIPTTTGAAKAIGLVMPELDGKLDGLSIRVPTPDGSLVDLVVEVEKETSIEEVNAALKAASEGALKDNMGYTEEPLVSMDFIGSTYGGVVDGPLTNVKGGTQVKVIIWYDNEAGFTNQLLRLIQKVAAGM